MHARRRAAALLVPLLLLTGCAGSAVGTPTDAPTGADEIPAVPGYDPATKTIRVGSLVPVSGVFAAAITQVHGGEAYFARATAPGGPLEGYTVEIVNYDSEYTPAVAIPLYQGAKDDVVMFQSILGTAIIQALLPSIRDDDMLVVPGISTEAFVTDPNIVPFGPIYPTYSAAGVDYAVNEEDLGDETFCSLTQDDESGASFREGFHFAMDELDLAWGVDVTYPTGNQDFVPQITQLKTAGCGVVHLAGTGGTLQNAAIKAVQLDFDATWLAPAMAVLATTATGPGAEYIIDHVRVFMTGTEWDGDEAPGQAMMQEDLAKLYPDYIPYANSYQTGYLSSITAAAVLERAIADRDLSRENLMKIAASLGEVDDLGMGGGAYVYGDSLDERTPSTALSVFRVDPAAPIGLSLEQFQYESPVAAKYSTER